MLRTVTMGNYISVQGMFVRSLPCGKIAVRVGDRIYEGQPVGRS